MNLTVNNEDFNGIVLQEHEGRVTTTSRDIAEKFCKDHKVVLRAIRNLECSDEFNGNNFAPVEYVDAKGEARTEYAMTRDGFAFLAMGFTGKEAAAWKEKYIAAFNALAKQLLAPLSEDQMIAQSLNILSQRNDALRIENSALAPKAAEFDHYLDTDAVCLISDFCNKHQVKKNHPGYALRSKGMLHQKKLLATQVGLKSGILKNIVAQDEFTYVDSKGRSVEAQKAQVVVSQENKLLGWILDEYGMTAFRNKPAFEQAKNLIGGAT